MVLTVTGVPCGARTDGSRARGVRSGAPLGAGGHSNERSNPASPRPDHLLRSPFSNPQSQHPDAAAAARAAAATHATEAAAEGRGHGVRTDGTRDR